jgi:hypothetical protein
MKRPLSHILQDLALAVILGLIGAYMLLEYL